MTNRSMENVAGATEQAWLRRLAWRCRRGMLELDLVLENFVREHYLQLEANERHLFEVLLEMPDTQLWDMITGKTQPEDVAQQQLLLKINQINRGQPDNVGEVNG